MEDVSPGSSASFFRKPPPPPPGSVPPPWTPAGSSPDARIVSPPRRPSFHGSGGSLLGIHIVNVLLTLVTVGVYYCWAKTRVRRYLYSESGFEGDRFAYHGTGKELLLGFLRAFVVFLLPIIFLTIVRDQLDVDRSIKTVAAFLVSVLFLILIPVATVGSRRYRLTRTSWRGIRFSFRGRAKDFIVIFITGYFLTGLTFGLYYPFYLTRRQAFLVSKSYFGNERFDFDGNGWDLFRGFVLLHPPHPPDARDLLDLVPGPEATLLLGPHGLPRSAVSLDGERRSPPRSVPGQCAAPGLYPGHRMAMGQGAEHPLRLPLSRAGGAARSRAHPAAGAVRFRHRRRAGGVPRHRLRPRLMSDGSTPPGRRP